MPWSAHLGGVFTDPNSVRTWLWVTALLAAGLQISGIVLLGLTAFDDANPIRSTVSSCTTSGAARADVLHALDSASAWLWTAFALACVSFVGAFVRVVLDNMMSEDSVGVRMATWRRAGHTFVDLIRDLPTRSSAWSVQDLSPSTTTQAGHSVEWWVGWLVISLDLAIHAPLRLAILFAGQAFGLGTTNYGIDILAQFDTKCTVDPADNGRLLAAVIVLIIASVLYAIEDPLLKQMSRAVAPSGN